MPYARYSDDIIVFAPGESEIADYREDIAEQLTEMHLEVNPAKESLTRPGEAWDFLGISYCQGVIDLSDASKAKLKGKIRRKARALRRWWVNRGQPPQRAMAAMIRSFNRKLFGDPVGDVDGLNWARWFFPLLTTDSGLHAMDGYLQQYLRWIPTGRFTAANYRTRYAELKSLGYRSLVHEYHEYRNSRAQTTPTTRSSEISFGYHVAESRVSR